MYCGCLSEASTNIISLHEITGDAEQRLPNVVKTVLLEDTLQRRQETAAGSKTRSLVLTTCAVQETSKLYRVKVDGKMPLLAQPRLSHPLYHKKGNGTTNALFVFHIWSSQQQYGYRSKSNHEGTAGFSPCFRLLGFNFGYLFLTHTPMF